MCRIRCPLKHANDSSKACHLLLPRTPAAVSNSPFLTILIFADNRKGHDLLIRSLSTSSRSLPLRVTTTRRIVRNSYPKNLCRWQSVSAQAANASGGDLFIHEPPKSPNHINTLQRNVFGDLKIRDWPWIAKILYNEPHSIQSWAGFAESLGAKFSQTWETDQPDRPTIRRIAGRPDYRCVMSLELGDGRTYASIRDSERQRLAAQIAGLDLLAICYREEIFSRISQGELPKPPNRKIHKEQDQVADSAQDKDVQEEPKQVTIPAPTEDESRWEETEAPEKPRQAVAADDNGVLLDPTPFSVGQKLLTAMAKASEPILKSWSSVAEQMNGKGATKYGQVQKRQTSSRHPVPPFITAKANRMLLDQYNEWSEDPSHAQLRDAIKDLPMSQYQSQVLDIVNNNQYSIISGETGCGKTTQVPRIILDDAIRRGVGSEVEVICTQPRQMASKEIAKRVAAERNQVLGQSVGYHVRDDYRPPRQGGGSITYCTTGVLLQQIKHHDNSIMDFASHIIVDEVHERSLDIDFLLITLKTIIEDRKKAGKRTPKVVLMSATIEVDRWAEYFAQTGEDNIQQPCPALSVPGRAFPVRTIHLDEILAECNSAYGDRETSEIISACSSSKRYLAAERSEPPSSEGGSLVPFSLVALTIAHIVKTTSTGAVLAFLPGFSEIRDVMDELRKGLLNINFGDPSKYRIILLHSHLSAGQEEAFEPVPEGCRKIILSTNIAETSITIPDVHHVVDAGKHRVAHYDPISRVKELKCVWISKSSSKQRAGRAGRVQNGNYYALFSEARFNTLQLHENPEILANDLQSVCLAVKSYSPDYDIADFLSGAFTPPLPSAVQASIGALQDLGALAEDQTLTALGRLLASLPVGPGMGKLVVLGAIFRCFDPILILSAASSVQRSLFLSFEGDGTNTQRKESHTLYSENTDSDSLSLINAFSKAREMDNRFGSRHYEFKKFMKENFLDERVYRDIVSSATKIEASLTEIGLIPATDRNRGIQFGHPRLNTLSKNSRLVLAVALSGSGGNFAECTPKPKGSARKIEGMRFKTRRKFNGRVQSRSLIKKAVIPESKFISYGEIHRMNGDYILSNINQISPLAVALFGGSLKDMDGINLIIDDWAILYLSTDLTVWASNAQKVILDFRKALDIVLALGFADIARGKVLIDDPLRTAFADSLAQIIQQDDQDAIIAELTLDNLFPKTKDQIDNTQAVEDVQAANDLRDVIKSMMKNNLGANSNIGFAGSKAIDLPKRFAQRHHGNVL